MNQKQKVKAFFKSIDIFNKEMTFLTLPSNSLNVKSFIGGIISFLIVVTSALYIIFLFYEWFTG